MIRIDGYLVDLAISEDHSFPGEVTDFPVEQGPDISDHIRNLPEEIALECVVSDTPIGEAAADPSRQAVGAEAPLPSTEALAKLREIRAARRPVTIETTLGTFESMALVDLTVPKSRTTDGGLFFTVKFRRIEIVTNRRTRRRVATPLAGAGGKPAPKATVGRAWRVDNTLLWRKGFPPGGRVIGEETVSVVYNVPRGETLEGVMGELESNPAAGTWRGGYADYRGADGRLLRGAELQAFFLDMERDRRQKQQRQAQDLLKRREEALPQQRIRDAESNGVITRNLAPGVDLGKFTAPPTQPTFTAPPPIPVR